MNTIARPFQIKITNVEEVRMGSPYNGCNIELINFNKVKLPIGGWQGKFAWTDNSKRLVLIRWNFEKNTPGFHLFLIDIETGQTKESPRLLGLPNSISFEGNKIKINKFLYDKEKSTLGNLCCIVVEAFEFDS